MPAPQCKNVTPMRWAIPCGDVHSERCPVLSATLPIPRLTATVHQPTTKHGLGVVSISGLPDVRPTVFAAKRRHHCTRCLAPGHNRSSSMCPGRRAG